MSNLNTVLVTEFQATLINLHNELGRVNQSYSAEAKDKSYDDLDKILVRYGISGLKGTLVFESEKE